MTSRPGYRLDRPTLLFWGALLLGAAVRLYALGRVPEGLNSDEASNGVDALSILQTGMDRWGDRMPIWFPAWGSGMNALYTYIFVPVIALFGLDVVTLRGVGVAFGIATLPVAYVTARLYFGRQAALFTLWMLALLPWHVMSSRWALDSNLMPFWFTLGLFTIGKALQSGRWWPISAFIPWAVALYAYPVAMIPAVTAGTAVLYAFWRRIRPLAGLWTVGIGLAFLIASPFLMFLAKNQLHLARLPFEDILPFSVPALAATRMSQIRQSPFYTLFDNLTFFVSGYRDGLAWHQSSWFAPLTGAAPLMTVLAILAMGWECYRTRTPNVLLIVVLTAVVPFCLIPLQLTRFNWFYIPSLMLIGRLLTFPAARPALLGGGAYVALFLMAFYPYYFQRYNDELSKLDLDLGNGFRIGLEGALRAEVAAARPGEAIFIDIGTVHPYLYPLFYGLADIRSFQQTREMRIEEGVYRVSRFDRFVFETAALPENRSFMFVSRANRAPCPDPQIVQAGMMWTVGRCGK
jgi:hypothetical protein